MIIGLDGGPSPEVPERAGPARGAVRSTRTGGFLGVDEGQAPVRRAGQGRASSRSGLIGRPFIRIS